MKIQVTGVAGHTPYFRLVADNPPTVATLQRNERSSLDYGAGWRPRCLSTMPLLLYLNCPTFSIRLKTPSAGRIGSVVAEAHWR